MLTVKTLGNFQISWEGSPIGLGKQSTNNVVRLFMLFMMNLEKGLSRGELIRELFFQQDVDSDPGANLRITVYRLRQAMKKAGVSCPEKSDYILIEHGVYRWNPEIPVEVDALEFERLVRASLGEPDDEKSQLLGKQALALYGGEFLESLSSEEWVNRFQLRLMRLYRKLILHNYRILTEKEEYQHAYDIAKWASMIYPYEEFQVLMIDALIAMKRLSEAVELYEDTAGMYRKEMGLEPSDEMKKRFQMLSSQTELSESTMDGIRKKLKEGNGMDQGTWCSFPGFIDHFRFVQRLLSRTGQSAYIAVITLENDKHLPLDFSDPRTAEISEIMRHTICSSVRRGDMVSKYNMVSFLILLMCTNDRGCQIVQKRIEQAFRIRCSYRKIRIRCNAFPVLDIEEIQGQAPSSANGLIRLCIDGRKAEDIQGKAYVQYQKEPISFSNTSQFFNNLNQYFDRIGIPQSDTRLASLGKQPESVYNVFSPRIMNGRGELARYHGAVLTADLKVSHRLRSSWQGSVTILNGNSDMVFISELQLLNILVRSMGDKPVLP